LRYKQSTLNSISHHILVDFKVNIKEQFVGRVENELNSRSCVW